MVFNHYPAEFLKWNNPFSELSIIIYREIMMKTWSANSTEPGQSAWMCRLAWLFAGGKDLTLSVPAG